METLSPELALVDEELAQAARGRLTHPAFGEPMKPHPAPDELVEGSRGSRARRAGSGDRRRRAPLWLLAVVLTLGVTALMSSVTDTSSSEGSSPEIGAAVGRQLPTSQAPAPEAKSRNVPQGSNRANKARPPSAARNTQFITWPRVDGAHLYNIIFVSGERRVDFWSSENRLARPGSPTLEPGSYTWYVYPGLGTGSSVRYGSVSAHGSLVIP